MLDVRIQTDNFDLGEEEALASAHTDNCGALVAFVGKVRGKDHTQPLTHLYVEHFPDVTETEINKILQLASDKWPLAYAKVIHRIGDIQAGENIVLVVTACAHRKDAFAANTFIMDYLKTDAPFWKKEYFANGDAHWVDMKHSDQEARNTWESLS